MHITRDIDDITFHKKNHYKPVMRFPIQHKQRPTQIYTSSLTRDTPCTQRLSQKSTHCERRTRVLSIS